MRPISIPRIFLLLSVVIMVSCCKKEVGAVYQTAITEAREGLKENGGALKNG